MILLAAIWLTLSLHRNDPPVPLDRARYAKEILAHQKKQSTDVKDALLSASQCMKKGDDTATTIAVRKLAILRTPEAIPFLVEHLDFEPRGPSGFSSPSTLSESLPCVAALGHIGGVACDDAILKRFVASGSNDETEYARIILKMSLGCDDAIALVKGRAEREKDFTAAKRLRALADSIDRHERTTTYQ
jgi:hypothetical protein